LRDWIMVNTIEGDDRLSWRRRLALALWRRG
jgi:hypothetical protein